MSDATKKRMSFLNVFITLTELLTIQLSEQKTIHLNGDQRSRIIPLKWSEQAQRDFNNALGVLGKRVPLETLNRQTINEGR